MAESLPAVRRNGLLQSCEPCRKSKLRCDHGRPVCGRCTSKNITSRCFYHPAPMTKGDSPSQNRVVKNKKKPSPYLSSASSSQPYSGFQTTSESVLFPQSALSSTNFSAILTEHPTEILLSLDADSSTAGEATTKPTDPIRLDAGQEILGFLYRHRIFDTLIRKYYFSSLTAAVAISIVDSILKSIQRVFDNLDTHNGFENQLRDIVGQIFRSSSRRLATHGSMTVEEYCATFTDVNLRWEALGIVLASAGMALMCTPDSDPDLARVAADSQARDLLHVQTLEASGVCLGFCDQAASVNELLGFYQYNDMMLRTQHYGDSSFQAWRRLSDLTSTIYAAGLHQEDTKQLNDCPYFLHQWRKICFASAFFADKCLSTFVGRPPYINHRYCNLEPPLDLSEELFVTGGDRLDQAISELDPAGWCRHGACSRESIIRLRFLLAIFREQALEIALGTSFDRNIMQKSNEVIGKARQMWEACPARLRYDLYDKVEVEPLTTIFTLRHSYLDYLYSLFLIQKTIVKNTNTGQEALFDTSRRTLSIIVEINAERDPGLDLSRHYSWIVLYYGLPSASVLTLELLRQSQEANIPSVMLPRAELIRNLSVFVSCLSWVARPGHGNYKTCKAVEKKLSEILDQILDPQPAAQKDILDVDASSLYSLLEWYNPDNWDVNTSYFPSRDGFPF